MADAPALPRHPRQIDCDGLDFGSGLRAPRSGRSPDAARPERWGAAGDTLRD